MNAKDNGDEAKSPEAETTEPRERTRQEEAEAENLAWGERATKHFQRMTNDPEYRKAFQEKFPI